MATNLLQSVFSTCQNFMDLLSCPMPIYWDKTKFQWRFQLSSHIIKHYLYMTAASSIGVGITLVFYISAFSPYRIFEPQKLLIFVLCSIMGVPSMILFGAGMSKFGRDLVIIANWGIAAECKLNKKILKTPHNSLARVVVSECRKMFVKPNNPDVFGILALIIFISIPGLAAIMPVILFIDNADPFYVFAKVLNFNLLAENLLFRLVALIVTICVLVCGNMVFPVFLIFLMGLFHSVFVIINHWLVPRYNLTSLFSLHNQGNICINLAHSFIKKFCLGYLFNLFFGILVAANIVVFGFEFLPLQTYILSPFILCMLVLGMCLFFRFTTFCFENSSKAIGIWKMKAATKYDSKYLLRVIRSTRPVALHIGNLGIANTDMELLYLSTLLGYIANTLQVTRDILDG